MDSSSLKDNDWLQLTRARAAPSGEGNPELAAGILTLVESGLEHQRARNARVPISVLSDDLLENIFALCVPRLGAADFHPDVGWWTGFSQVCHQWRAVAMSRSALWTFIDFRRLPMAEEMMLRSTNTHVQVYFSLNNWRYSPHRFHAIFQHLLQISSRAQTWDLKVELSDDPRNERSPDSTIMPDQAGQDLKLSGLHYLDMSLKSAQTSKPVRIWVESPFAVRLLGINMPCLQELRLADLHIDWDAVVLPESIDRLRMGPFPWTSSLSPMQLVRALSCCPKLRSLQLVNAMRYDSEPGLTRTIARLFSLESLHLEDFTSAALQAVLMCLSVSSQTRISLHISPLADEKMLNAKQGSTDVVRALGHHLRMHDSVPVRKIAWRQTCEHSDDDQATIQVWPTHNTWGDPWLEVRIFAPRSRDEQDVALGDAIHETFGPVEEVTITEFDVAPQACFPVHLFWVRQLSHLRVVDLHAHVDAFVLALADSKASDGGQKVSLPKLATLPTYQQLTKELWSMAMAWLADGRRTAVQLMAVHTCRAMMKCHFTGLSTGHTESLWQDSLQEL